jgi:hypothetical protein
MFQMKQGVRGVTRTIGQQGSAIVRLFNTPRISGAADSDLDTYCALKFAPPTLALAEPMSERCSATARQLIFETKISLITPKRSLFSKILSLLIHVGKCRLSHCGTAVSCNQNDS